MNSRLGRASLWMLGVAAFGFLVLGNYVYELTIGLDWTAYPGGAAIESLARALGYGGQNAIAGLFFVAMGLGLVFVVIAWAAERRLRSEGSGVGRRAVLAAGAGAGAALVAGALAGARSVLGWGRAPTGWLDINEGIQAEVVKTHPEHLDAWKGARVSGYRRLGRTDWKVSDIVLGAGGVGRVEGDTKGEEIVRQAIDRGVTYVDTSPDYSAAGSEETVARGIAGQREKVFLATKFCTPWGHLGAGSPVSQYKEVIEESLRRLRTDYVDLAHVHACDEVDRLLDPNLHEAFDRLREEGKVRHLGFSSHTPNLTAVAEAAIDSGRFDVMMLAYHHGIWPRLAELIERARREQDMGVVAMKTLKGAKHHGLAGFREHADAYSQAALRWVLTNPDVSCAVITFSEFQHLDEYLVASGGSANAEDLAVLDAYDREITGSYCVPHCGACLGSCPEQLPIHDVLRHRMYFEDYGSQKEAMRLYGKLERNASACAGCSAPCLGSCPVGLDIKTRMSEAHDLLTLV